MLSPASLFSFFPYKKHDYSYSDYDDYDDDDYGKSYGKKSKKYYGKKYSSYGDDDYDYKDKGYKKDKGYYKTDKSYYKKDYDSYDDDYADNKYNDYKYNDYKKKDYNGYGYEDDNYNGYSKKSAYKRNGNFNGYKKSYSDYDYKDYDDYDSYYRKKRQYDYQSESEVKAVPNTIISIQPAIETAPLCAGKADGANAPHPTDSTKYIACLSANKQEIMDCPEGLIYDASLDRCENIQKTESICDSQPCLNKGQCHQTSPTTFSCTCLTGWTGDRCESPLSACAADPCGPGNTCHSLKAKDYPQDFVCLCNDRQTYGLTCERETVPNPCLATAGTSEQYHPFAFTDKAFIQCNGDLLYVQPCAAGLTWNQELKVCDLAVPASTAVPVIVSDQPVTYQLTSGTDLKQINVLPTVSFADQSLTSSNSYGSKEETRFTASNEESQSSYGSGSNRMISMKEVPKPSVLFNPLPSLPATRLTKHKTIVQPNSYGSNQAETQSRFLATDFLPTSYSRSFGSSFTSPAAAFGQQNQGFIQQTHEASQHTQEYGQKSENFFQRTERVGQNFPAQPLPRQQTFIPQPPAPQPYGTAINGYGSAESERTFIPQLPKRLPTPILQPERMRSAYGSGGY